MNYFELILRTLFGELSFRNWMALIFNNLVLSTIGIVLFSYVVLKLFYKVFELSWPELYFSVNDRTALFVSVSWQRYAAFRLAPLFLATSFAAGVFMRNYGSTENIQATVLSAAIYAFLTDGKAIYHILTKSFKVKTYFNSWYQVILHLATIIALLFTGFLSGLVAQTHLIKAVTPTLQGLADNLWSSLLVVLLAFYLKQIYSQEGLSEDIIFRRSLENIDPKVLRAIDTNSTKENANPILVKAVCMAENLQRPPWVRKIELVLSVFKNEGTYGIMQVKSKKRLSDTESVSVSVKKFFGNTFDIKDIDSLRVIIKRYNNDERYVDIVFKIMFFLDSQSIEYRG